MLYKESNSKTTLNFDLSKNLEEIEPIKQHPLKLIQSKDLSYVEVFSYYEFDKEFQAIHDAYVSPESDSSDIFLILRNIISNAAGKRIKYFTNFSELNISKILIEFLLRDYEIANIASILDTISILLSSHNFYVQNLVEANLIPNLLNMFNSEMPFDFLHHIVQPLTILMRIDKSFKDTIIKNVNPAIIFSYFSNNSISKKIKESYLSFLQTLISYQDSTQEIMSLYLQNLSLLLENWTQHLHILPGLLTAIVQYMCDFSSSEILRKLFDPFHQMVRDIGIIPRILTILDEINMMLQEYHKQKAPQPIPDPFSFGQSIVIGGTDDVTDDQKRCVLVSCEQIEKIKSLSVPLLDFTAVIFEVPFEYEINCQTLFDLALSDQIDIRTEIFLVIGNLFESMPLLIDVFQGLNFFDYLQDIILNDPADNRTQIEALICLSTAICVSSTAMRLNFATVDYLQILFESLYHENNPLPYMILRAIRCILEAVQIQNGSDQVMELFTEIDGFTLPEIKNQRQHDTKFIEEAQLLEKLINSIMEKES